jgi:hypothetical protein
LPGWKLSKKIGTLFLNGEAGKCDGDWYWTCSTTLLVVEQVLQNALHFAFLSGCCSETEVSEQLY